jgi:hypothetical protein
MALSLDLAPFPCSWQGSVKDMARHSDLGKSGFGDLAMVSAELRQTPASPARRLRPDLDLSFLTAIIPLADIPLANGASVASAYF